MATDSPLYLLLLAGDADWSQALAAQLRAAGHRVRCCWRIADTRSAPAPDLALFDLQLPDGDGLDLLRDWRAAGQVWPMIVLTAHDQVSERIRGLQAGADDCMVKPVDLDELLARVNAVSRRLRVAAAACQADRPDRPDKPDKPDKLDRPDTADLSGRWQLDFDAHSACRGADRPDLTQMEWAVLACLAQRRGRICSRNQIDSQLDAAGLSGASSNSLEVIVSRLRKKLGADLISTHRGLGYRLEA